MLSHWPHWIQFITTSSQWFQNVETSSLSVKPEWIRPPKGGPQWEKKQRKQDQAVTQILTSPLHLGMQSPHMLYHPEIFSTATENVTLLLSSPVVHKPLQQWEPLYTRQPETQHWLKRNQLMVEHMTKSMATLRPLDVKQLFKHDTTGLQSIIPCDHFY